MGLAKANPRRKPAMPHAFESVCSTTTLGCLLSTVSMEGCDEKSM